MSKMLVVKIGSYALVAPILAGIFMVEAHRSREQKAHAPKVREPQVIEEKPVAIRKYNTGGNMDKIYIFTSPGNPDEHCVVTKGESAVYNCYPNAPGLKPGTGGPLDVRHYKEPTIHNMMIFDDPENPALYCMENTHNFSITCHPKRQGAAPQTPGLK